MATKLWLVLIITSFVRAQTTPTNNAQTPGSNDLGANVDLLLGVGSRISGTGVTSYKTTANSILEVTNVGRATPQAMVGLGIPFCGSDAKKQSGDGRENWACNNVVLHRLGAFISTQFGSGDGSTLTAYNFGVSFHINSLLHALIGYSMSPVQEPSPGFRAAAKQYAIAHPDQFQGIDPNAFLANRKDIFSGFQYVIPASSGAGAGAAIYPGDVLSTHYRSGLFIGVAFPLSLKARLDNGK